MKRILSKYGAYISHIASLSPILLLSQDRAKLKGYYQKWPNAKYLLGYAFYIDLLVICTKVMQLDDLDILSTLNQLDKICQGVSSTSLDK